MIELKQVSKKYGDLKAVNNISLNIDAGQVCVIIGPSGCGKSTTLKLINRMFEPTSGEILVDGKNINTYRPELLRRKIGYVIQDIGLFPHMTVAANIAVVPRLLSWKKNKIEKRIDELLQIVGLEPEKYRHKLPGQLSGGEAQRIGVARAIAANPPILLADEPFGAVDPLTREKLQAEFINIQQQLKKTIVFVTHDLDEAIRLADRIVLMNNGEVLQYDTPENILAHPVNNFVRDFIGTDRALKRLSRYSVSDVISQANSFQISKDSIKEFKQKEPSKIPRFLWVLDDKKRLIGWINTSNIRDIDDIETFYTKINPSEISVRKDSTLREALSRMLGQCIKTVPVVDKKFHLLGEVSLADIEKITEKE